MINDLPTIFEVVNGTAKINLNDKSNFSNHSSSTKSESNPKPPPQPTEEEGLDNDNDNDNDEETLCGSCGENYTSDEFWIGCDICEKWFHGKCVKITPARAELMEQYKCPSCTDKRARL